MLSPTLETVRMFLHVLAAAVWVGGQIVLGGLVPSLRRAFPDSGQVVAQAFARVAWPAFAIVVVTGLWSLGEISVAETSTSYQVTLFVKILLVMTSGAAAFVHQIGQTKAALAVGGALGLLAALGAMFCGLLLTTGT
jgi:putative copper export protein